MVSEWDTDWIVVAAHAIHPGKERQMCAANIPPKVLAVAWQWPVLTRNEPLYLQQTAALGPSLEQL